MMLKINKSHVTCSPQNMFNACVVKVFNACVVKVFNACVVKVFMRVLLRCVCC